MADNTAQRQNVASKVVDAATRLTDALYDLLQLKDQRDKFISPFQDSDFVGSDLKHLSAGMLGQIFDFVIPSLQANFIDAANGNRNQQNLFQVRKS